MVRVTSCDGQLNFTLSFAKPGSSNCAGIHADDHPGIQLDEDIGSYKLRTLQCANSSPMIMPDHQVGAVVFGIERSHPLRPGCCVAMADLGSSKEI